MPAEEILELLLRKKNALEKELILAYDVEKKFALTEQIKELKQEIEGLEKKQCPSLNLFIPPPNVDCLRNDGTCLLDFTFLNSSKNGILVHELIFTLISLHIEQVLGEVNISSNYNLDIGRLEKPGDMAKIAVNQFIKPGEPERFTVTLSDKTLKNGAFKKWKLSITFSTNLGLINSEPIQIYLPWDLQESGIQPA